MLQILVMQYLPERWQGGYLQMTRYADELALQNSTRRTDREVHGVTDVLDWQSDCCDHRICHHVYGELVLSRR